ncbi:hypothetical protein TGRH88_031120 [Toxoplasma gondii]|uniref:Secreted protein n=1 Tax=Toxoplasma gondii TaxID=5811 RepID=A0A7J6KAA0_TOXGO|nr:hypothetical protein TGRH88_031120 [Toxoplasma gondii]
MRGWTELAFLLRISFASSLIAFSLAGSCDRLARYAVSTIHAPIRTQVHGGSRSELDEQPQLDFFMVFMEQLPEAHQIIIN